MIKGNDVIGKPVLRKEKDEQAETVHDIIFDPETNRILGFVIDEDSPLDETRIVLWEGVEKIDGNGVTLLSEKYLIPAGYAPPIQKMIAHGNMLNQSKAVTTDGQEVGQPVDVYFNPTTGEVEGFEVVETEAKQSTPSPLFVPMAIVTEVNRNMVVINAAVANVLDWGRTQ
jgi:uncharacterized protein YrrD